MWDFDIKIQFGGNFKVMLEHLWTQRHTENKTAQNQLFISCKFDQFQGEAEILLWRFS